VKQLYSSIGVLAITLVLLVGLLRSNPFGAACDGLDRLFGAPPKWTQVTNVYRNPKTQEMTHGDDPTASLDGLKQYWHQFPGAGRIVFIGNSQMHTISLAPGEPPRALRKRPMSIWSWIWFGAYSQTNCSIVFLRVE